MVRLTLGGLFLNYDWLRIFRGRFLAKHNERNRRAAVKQRDGGIDLFFPDTKLLCNLLMNLWYANSH